MSFQVPSNPNHPMILRKCTVGPNTGLGTGDFVSHSQAINLSLNRLSPLQAILGSAGTSLVIFIQLTPDKLLCSHMQSCQQTQHLPTSRRAPLAQGLQGQKKTKPKSLAGKTRLTVQDCLLFPGLLLQLREQGRAVLSLELEERYSAFQEASRLPATLSGFVLRYFGACSYLRQTVSHTLCCVCL